MVTIETMELETIKKRPNKGTVPSKHFVTCCIKSRCRSAPFE